LAELHAFEEYKGYTEQNKPPLRENSIPFLGFEILPDFLQAETLIFNMTSFIAGVFAQSEREYFVS